MDEDHMEEQNEEQGQKTRTGREQAKAMDKMTDHIAERELDASKAQSAMTALAASQKADREAQLKREKELAAVKVAKEDIDLVAAEFEIDRKVAERKLRECGGSAYEALKALMADHARIEKPAATAAAQ